MRYISHDCNASLVMVVRASVDTPEAGPPYHIYEVYSRILLLT